MFSHLKIYLYGGLAICVAISYYATYQAGKDNVISKMKSDRITVLQDGKKIDNDVLAADDDALYCMLVSCNN